MPKPLAAFGSVSLDGRLIVGGGIDSGIEMISSKMYEFICLCSFESCIWAPLEQTLSVPRAGMVIIPVPDDIVSCQ